MKKFKSILLAVATATIVGVSLYLRYFSGTPLRAPEMTPQTPSTGDGGDPGTEASEEARPRIREVPQIAFTGLKGDLAYLRMSTAENRRMIIARMKQGRAERS